MQEQRHRLHRTNAPLGWLWLLITVALSIRPGLAAATPAQPPYSLPNGAESPTLQLESPVGPLRYTLGRGLQVGDTPFTLGGYSNVNLVRDEGGPAQLKWDDLSFFVIAQPSPRFHLFSELEFEDLLEVDDHGRGGTSNSLFTVERLYGDASGSDEINLRVGKFLTPVGRWNVIHAQPLVWTTSRPLVTTLPFDNHVTGAMLFGSFFPTAGTVSYSLYGQFVNQFEPVEQPQPADRSAGARFEYTAPGGLSLGTSFFAFTHRGDWQQLAGLDTLWQHGRFELMGEFAYEAAPRDPGSQWGLYLQGVAEVVRRFYLVGRYEHFDQRMAAPEVNLFDLGLAYKPLPPLVLKAEYLIADHRAEEAPPGFKCSFAILF